MEKTENVTAVDVLNTNTIIGNEPSYVQYLLELAKWQHGKRIMDISTSTGIPNDWISRLKHGIRNSTPSVTDWVGLCDEAGIKMQELTAIPHGEILKKLKQFEQWAKHLAGDWQRPTKEVLRDMFAKQSLNVSDTIGYGTVTPIKLAQALEFIGLEDRLGFYQTYFPAYVEK